MPFKEDPAFSKRSMQHVKRLQQQRNAAKHDVAEKKYGAEERLDRDPTARAQGKSMYEDTMTAAKAENVARSDRQLDRLSKRRTSW
jgi:hypothetical protein